MIAAVAEAEPIVRGAIVQELLVAARYGWELTQQALRAEGVDPAEYGPLSFVGTLQPVTRTQLTQAMGLRRTTLRDLVARLIERGHVREEPNPRDGRSTLLTLTPAGQEIFDSGCRSSGACSRRSTPSWPVGSTSTRWRFGACASRCRD